MESERFVHKILCTVILKIVNYPLESERETVSEQFQGSWRLGTAQALHAQYKYVSSVDIRHLGTPYERVPRFLSTRELMVGNLRDSEAARYVLAAAACRALRRWIVMSQTGSRPNDAGRLRTAIWRRLLGCGEGTILSRLWFCLAAQPGRPSRLVNAFAERSMIFIWS